MLEDRTNRLVTLISVNQDDLFRYIFGLIPHNEDARDVLQETLLAITEKFDDYDPCRPFLPWAYKFAFHRAMKHRDHNPRRVHNFSTDVLELLAVAHDNQAPILHARLMTLEQCLEKLPAADRLLLRERYGSTLNLDEIASQVRQSRRTLLRNLKRLRDWLHDCVNRHVVLGGET